MNASELYEIVKDVPKFTWPKGLRLHNGKLRQGRITWMIRTAQVLPDHAELMFFAAFTRHLIGQGFHLFEWGGNDNGTATTITIYDLIEVTIERVRGCDARLECLAAAIKKLQGK